MAAGMKAHPLSPTLESILGGMSQARYAETLAKYVKSSSAEAAKAVVQELLDHPHAFYKMLGAICACVLQAQGHNEGEYVLICEEQTLRWYLQLNAWYNSLNISFQITSFH